VSNTYSFSKIQEYINCPYKYKLIYINKLKRGRSKYTSFGLSLEDSIEHIYNNSSEYVNNKDYITQLLKDFWVCKQYKKDYTNEETHRFLGYASKKEEADYFKNGVNYLYDYFQLNTPRKQIAFELPFTVPYKNWFFTGRIDHIKKEDDKIILIDNKVSSYIIYNISNNLQVGLYIYAIKVLQPKLRITDAGFYYIPLQKLSTIKVKEFDINYVLSTLEKHINEIEDATIRHDFKPKVNNFCKTCEFKEKSLTEEDYEKCPAYR